MSRRPCFRLGGIPAALLTCSPCHQHPITMYIDRLVLLFIAGAFLLSPAIIEWWSEGGTAWYRPYIIWMVLIGISFWIGKSRDLNDMPQ